MRPIVKNTHMTLDQCVKELVLVSQSGEAYYEPRVDAVVDSYLVGFGSETSMRRDELARAFRDAASVSEVSDRVLKNILRQIS